MPDQGNLRENSQTEADTHQYHPADTTDWNEGVPKTVQQGLDTLSNRGARDIVFFADASESNI
jgi:hypothetical protein